MSQADKEQERLKKQLEKLRKQPGNSRCANCASMSVPYVCVDYQTFVCTRCSALHRDLTHRVKALSASKFKPEEVASFAGNEHDAQRYLKYWNEQLFRLPGAGNEETQRAREFLQAKYVELRWADEALRGQFQQPFQQQPPQPAQHAPPAQPTQPVPAAAQPTYGAPNPFAAFGLGQPQAQAQPVQQPP